MAHQCEAIRVSLFQSRLRQIIRQQKTEVAQVRERGDERSNGDAMMVRVVDAKGRGWRIHRQITKLAAELASRAPPGGVCCC
jgi:hypothetical protein